MAPAAALAVMHISPSILVMTHWLRCISHGRAQVEMAPAAALAVVRETVENVARLGRICNIVQHPSIAAPFLSRATVVHSNGHNYIGHN